MNNKEQTRQTVQQHLREYINTHGLRHTQEREVILDAICDLKQFTIEELRDKLTKLTISRATVYNTLQMLLDAHIVQKMDKAFGVRAGQYELVLSEESSVKVICQKCGRVGIIKDPTINRMLQDKRYANFVPERYSLYIFGSCKLCRRKISR